MSFTYIVEIKQGKSLVEATTTDDLSKAVTYADNSSIVGDLVVISEGYEGSDGGVDKHDHVTSWYVD
jgi:hypothetical protein